MQKVKNKIELLQVLQNNLQKIKEDTIAILAGHFPLRVDADSKQLKEDFKVWGDFSLFTLEVGNTIGQMLKKNGKNVIFVFLCDDNFYRDIDKKILANSKILTETQLDNRWRSARNKLYKIRSGKSAELPKAYADILNRYGFTVTNVLRHDHKKLNRHNCLYFSEAVLRGPKQIANPKKIPKQTNPCSREYTALIESEQFLIKGKKPYLISFIPQKCSHFICDAVDIFIENFKGIHIFLETQNNPSEKELFTTGNGVWIKINNN